VGVYSEAFQFEIEIANFRLTQKVEGERRFEMEFRAQIIGISFIVGMIIGIEVGRITENMGFWITIISVIGILVGAVIATVRTSQKGE
jgi:hypothetical protein